MQQALHHLKRLFHAKNGLHSWKNVVLQIDDAVEYKISYTWKIQAIWCLLNNHYITNCARKSVFVFQIARYQSVILSLQQRSTFNDVFSFVQYTMLQGYFCAYWQMVLDILGKQEHLQKVNAGKYVRYPSTKFVKHPMMPICWYRLFNIMNVISIIEIIWTVYCIKNSQIYSYCLFCSGYILMHMQIDALGSKTFLCCFQYVLSFFICY